MIRPRGFSQGVAAALVATLAFAALWPVLGNGFVNFDDGVYVTENRQVLGGFSREGLRWAFTTGHAANWHPLAWLSHMADVQLFGLRASGHHLTSLLLHAGATVLLFAALSGMTGARLRSFFAAAFFATHPLHVESVAWVAERKDVLAGALWMATLAAYLRYVRLPRTGTYLLVFACFAAGLLAKPTLVTLPLVLLLLDYWPLGRFPGASPRAVVLEKLPLLVLSAAVSVKTYVAQEEAGAVQSLAQFGMAHRLSDAVLAYAGYLGKMFWPRDLSAIYLSPGITWPDPRLVACLVLLLALSALAIGLARRAPYALVGWLWYTGALVPVIGLVKVGAQAMADRYTYVPLVGLFVALVWGADDLGLRTRPPRGRLVAAAGGTALLACLLLSREQARVWKDSVSLFERAVAAAPGNWAARHLYALALARHNRYPEAVAMGIEAFRVGGSVEKLGMLGDVLEGRDRHAEVAALFAGALGVRRDAHTVRYRLANALLRLGRRGEAIAHYEAVLLASPDHGHARNNLGVALHGEGSTAAAVAQYREALRVDPRNAEAHNNLGVALRSLGHSSEAEAQFREAVRDNPTYLAALRNLAGLLEGQGRAAESSAWRRRADDLERAGQEARAELERFHGR